MAPKDPRLSNVPKTVNEEAQERAIRHLLRLIRVTNREAAEIVDFLDKQVLPDLVEKIAGSLSRMNLSGGRIEGTELQRLQRLAAGLDEILDQLGAPSGPNSIYQRLATRMTQIAQTEAQWSASMLADVIPFKVETSVPSVNLLRSLVRNQPFDGAPLDEWFQNLGRSAREKIVRQVRIGMVEGEGMDQIIRRIRGTAASNYTDGVLQKNLVRHAEAITRSAVIHSSSVAQMETFRANDDLVKATQWVATLDTRTCEQCMSLDGQTWDLGDGPSPPVHIQCRCVKVPVLKSWREAGFDLDEAPPGTRASMNGQVPETLTYKEWLKRQSVELQKEALGPARYKLWKQGKLEISDFVNERGQILTLQQLRKLEGVDLPDVPGVQEADIVPDWKPAPNKKQAEQIGRNLGFSDVNYNGLDLDTANAINEGAYWMSKKMNQLVADDIIFKKTASKGIFGRIRQKYVGKRTPDGAKYSVEKQFNMSTSGKKVGQVNEHLTRGLKRNADDGFLSPGASIQSTSAHEMGHYYMSRIYDKVYGAQNLSRAEIGKRVTAWRTYEIPEEIIDDALAALGRNRDYMEDVYSTLGTYSRENPHETISMAIQYEFDNPGQLDFCQEILNQMKARL